jgi:hypothetical protein
MSLLNSASLVVTPNGYKEGTLYSVIPNTTLGDMTVVRATTATRVNSAGLVEVVSLLGNELVTNGDFATDTNWSKSANTTISGGQAIFTANGANQSLIQANAWVADSLSGKKVQLTYTIISNSLNAGSFRLGGITGASAFNINTLNDSVGTYTVILDVRTSAGTDNAIDFYITSTATSGTLVIDNVSIKEVITNNIPRLDYSNGSCPSLLVEPQRTNLITYSEDFNNAIWSKVAAGTGIAPIVTSNYAISPNGTQNADRIQFNLNGGTSSGDTSYITTILSAGTIDASVSIYLKTNDSTTKDITLRLGAGLFDYDVTVTSQWQRFTLSGNTNVDRVQLLLYGNQNSQTADLSVWGAQVEAGSYPTSYIPTSGSTVTRNADVISKTGISSLIGQTEGTLYFEVQGFSDGNPASQFITLNDGTTNNQIGFLYTLTLGRITGYFRVNSATLQITSTVLKTLNSKIILKYNSSNVYTLFINGSLIGTGTAASSFSSPLTAFKISQGNGSSPYNGKIKSIVLYQTALTNDQCIDLTT